MTDVTGTLMGEVLQELDRKARTGEPEEGWECTLCGREMRTYFRRVEVEPARGKRPPVIDYQAISICPCCSFRAQSGCGHWQPPGAMR